MKPNWILLRGLARESGHWGSFLADFRKAFADCTIYPLDIAGAGIHFQNTSPRSIEAMMEQIRAEYFSLRKDDRPVAILGHSLGAMIALAWATAHPAEITRTVLVNPSAAGLSPLTRRLQPYGIKVGWKLLFARSSRAKEQAIMEWIINDEGARARYLEEWTHIRDTRPVSWKNIYRQLAAGARYRLGDRKPTCPVLILNGEGDRLAHPSCSRALQNRLSSSLETHPTAGHDLSLDAPSWMISQILHWLSSLAK